MPASDPSPQGAGARLLTAAFWLGVALASAATLLLVLSGSSLTLRLAGALGMVAVLLVGVSVKFRRGAVPAEIEDMILDEVDALNDDVREDIATAARATHKAFSEKVAALTETIETLRAQVDNLRGQLEQRAAAPAAPAVPAGAGAPRPAAGRHGGVVRHTETVQVTTRQTIVDPNEAVGGRSGTVYGSRPAEPAAALPHRADWAESGQQPWSSSPEQHWSAASSSERHWSAGSSPEQPSRSAGAWSVPAAHEPVRAAAPVAGPTEESWTEKLLRERLADKDRADSSGELRMGERRAAVRSDGSGTELRIEDRWAAVRRETGRGERRADSDAGWETGRSGESDRSGGWERIPEQRTGGRSPSWWDQPRTGDGRRPESARDARAGGARAALPAGGSEPAAADWGRSGADASWGWPAEPVPERGADRATDRGADRGSDRGHRRGGEGADRQGWGGRPDATADGGARRGRLVDFEVTDDRWR